MLRYVPDGGPDAAGEAVCGESAITIGRVGREDRARQACANRLLRDHARLSCLSEA